MRRLCFQLKRILEVVFIGISRKPETEYIPQKSVLSSDSYEDIPIIYRARPIDQKRFKELSK